jgi:hypothetical protein
MMSGFNDMLLDVLKLTDEVKRLNKVGYFRGIRRLTSKPPCG